MMHLIVNSHLLYMTINYSKCLPIHSPGTKFRVYSYKCFMTFVLKMFCVLDVFICLLVGLSAEWHQNNQTDFH